MTTKPPGAENTLRRSRRRPPRRAGNFYLRVIGVVLAGIGIATGLFVFVMKVIHPYQLGYAVQKDIRVVRAELTKQEAANSLLERRLAYLKTDEGAEAEARSKGYARPGEVVYYLRRPNNNGSQPAP